MMHAPQPAQPVGKNEWRDGWRLLLACALGAMLAALPLNTVGVFMRPLAQEFGWDSAQMSAAVPINGWIIALSAPFMGIFIDRLGARRVGLLGCILLPASIAGLSLIQSSIYTYWAAWMAIALSQIVANIMIWTMPVAGRFAKNRGMALAIVLMGNSAAGICYSPIATLMIENWGWRMAYLVTGGGIFLLCMPLVWLYFHDVRDLARLGIGAAKLDSPAAPKVILTGMTGKQAMRTRQFWQLALAVGLGGGSAIAMFIHIVPIVSSAGLSPLQAASAVSALGFASLVSKGVVGVLVDRMRAPPLAAATMLGPLVSCLIFLSSGELSYGWALLAACLIGVATGAELDMIGVLVARLFGMAQYGRIYGMMLTAFQIAVGLGPLLVGVAFDRHHNYDGALTMMSVCFACCILLLLTLGKTRCEAERQVP